MHKQSIWPQALIQHFQKFVGPADVNGCRLWLGSTFLKGYGCFSFQGKTYRAHRIGLAIRDNIPLPPSSIHAAHHCYDVCGKDNKLCVEHIKWLWADTHREDQKTKGQYARGDQQGSRLHPETRPKGDAHWLRKHPGSRSGEQNWNHKLCESDVRHAIQRLADGESVSDVAIDVGVSYGCIRKIKLGETWKCLQQKKSA